MGDAPPGFTFEPTSLLEPELAPEVETCSGLDGPADGADGVPLPPACNGDGFPPSVPCGADMLPPPAASGADGFPPPVACGAGVLPPPAASDAGVLSPPPTGGEGSLPGEVSALGLGCVSSAACGTTATPVATGAVGAELSGDGTVLSGLGFSGVGVAGLGVVVIEKEP